MGIVFNNRKRIGFGYKIKTPCLKQISRRRILKRLTPQNLQLLKNHGLKIVKKEESKKNI